MRRGLGRGFGWAPPGALGLALLLAAGGAGADGVCDVAVAGGSLLVACDDEDNDVVVDQVGLAAGQFRLSTGADPTLFDLSGGPVAGPVVVGGVTVDVRIDMGGGQEFEGQCVASEQPSGRCPGDHLEVADALIPRDLRITSADGRNEVLLVDSEVGRDVIVVNGGGGSETDCESSAIGGSLKYTNGEGFNEAKIDECEVGANVQISNLAGSSVLDIESGTVIHGNVQLSNGDGETHELGVEESEIGGSLRVRNGSAEEIVIEMEASEGTEVAIGGDINVKNGAADLHVFELEGAEGEENFNVGGSIRISNGPGDSEVTLEKDVWVGGNLLHSSGRGSDEFAFEAGIEVEGSVRIEHGSGGSETVLEESEIGVELKVTANGGEDLVELSEVEIGGRTGLGLGANDDEVVVEDSTFEDAFTAEGGSGTDTYQDGGGNDFQGSFQRSGFEIIL
jgi:hypothetical protein